MPNFKNSNKLQSIYNCKMIVQSQLCHIQRKQSMKQVSLKQIKDQDYIEIEMRERERERERTFDSIDKNKIK